MPFSASCPQILQARHQRHAKVTVTYIGADRAITRQKRGLILQRAPKCGLRNTRESSQDPHLAAMGKTNT